MGLDDVAGPDKLRGDRNRGPGQLDNCKIAKGGD